MDILNRIYSNKELQSLVADVQVKAAASTLQLRKLEGMPVDGMSFMNMIMAATRIPNTKVFAQPCPGGYYSYCSNSEDQVVKMGFSSEDYKSCVAYNPLVLTEEVEITEGEYLDLVGNPLMVDLGYDVYAPMTSDVEGDLNFAYIRSVNNGEYFVVCEMEKRL